MCVPGGWGRAWLGGGRTAGPDGFPAPCALVVTLDPANGTLAMRVLAGEDPGAVIGSIPKQERATSPGERH